MIQHAPGSEFNIGAREPKRKADCEMIQAG